MQDIQYTEIKTTYYYGGKISLTPSWNRYNVICPTSKFYFMIDGEIKITTDAGEYILKKGDATLIPAEVKHSFMLTEKNYGVKYWFHFDITQGGDFFSRLDFNYVTNIKEYNETVNLFNIIAENDGKNTAFSNLEICSAVNKIVALFLKNANLKNGKNSYDDIDKIINLIKESPSNEFNLEQLANNAHLSPNYFIRKFKERTGFSPIKYVIYIKLERAKALLEGSEKTISEIMNLIGFCDSAYFSKLFKLHTGYSPRKYRDVYGKHKQNFKY